MNLDFIGFSFNGVHSSYLGLKRISDGSYYNEILQPNFENKLNQVPGRDGQYYFGSDETDKEITIKVAFDSVTEKQFRQITTLFATKKMCPLILDERPYKMYNVKLVSPINLSYICFDEPIRITDESREGLRVIDRQMVPIDPEDPDSEKTLEITRETVYPYKYQYDENGKKITQRIYKGEGEISFICVSPMAKAPFKKLDSYLVPRLSYDVLTDASQIDTNLIISYNNVNEWAEASGILDEDNYDYYNIDTPQSVNTGFYNIWINVYNPGDKDSPFILYLPYTIGMETRDPGSFESQLSSVVTIYSNGFKTMEIAPFTARAPYTEETGVCINSKNHLIEGVRYNPAFDTWSKTGNLYNDYIVAGDFTLITKQDIFQNVINNSNTWKQSINIDYNANPSDVWIKYDYLYY